MSLKAGDAIILEGLPGVLMNRLEIGGNFVVVKEPSSAGSVEWVLGRNVRKITKVEDSWEVETDSGSYTIKEAPKKEGQKAKAGKKVNTQGTKREDSE